MVTSKTSLQRSSMRHQNGHAVQPFPVVRAPQKTLCFSRSTPDQLVRDNSQGLPLIAGEAKLRNELPESSTRSSVRHLDRLVAQRKGTAGTHPVVAVPTSINQNAELEVNGPETVNTEKANPFYSRNKSKNTSKSKKMRRQLIFSNTILSELQPEKANLKSGLP